MDIEQRNTEIAIMKMTQWNDKEENQSFLKYKEIQLEQLQSHII
jgi:hypothetical protein